MKDGWNEMEGYDVYVEDGRVNRGTIGDGVSYRAAYPYKYDVDMKCFVNCSGISVDDFIEGVRSGNIVVIN